MRSTECRLVVIKKHLTPRMSIIKWRIADTPALLLCGVKIRCKMSISDRC